MNKLIPLAAAIAVFPLMQKKAGSESDHSFFGSGSVKSFLYKNTITSDPFAPEKKIAEPWSQNWVAATQENIRKSEYHFKWEEKLNAYCTPNRKNNLRFFYTDKGFTVEPRTTKIPIGDVDPLKMPDEIKYRNIPNWKVKFNLDKKQISNGKWQIVNNKAEYISKNITIQYINNDEGMRQNFIVHKPLSKDGKLKIKFSINSKLKTRVSQTRLQFFHKKTNVLNYEDLKVWDANGKMLDASFKKSGAGKYTILVNTKNAVYPITIDPISTTPNAQLESNQAGANMGASVAGAGDVNGDGYSDVVVGVHGYDNPEGDEGAAFVYHGSATGISLVPAVILENNQPVARLGLSVSTAGDVNGDGYSDIIVGTPLFDNGESNEGAFLVYHGSASGIVATPVTFVESNQIAAQLGYSVASAGDVNGDGYSDVVVGAWLYDNPEANEGVAFVYYGGASGISTFGNSIVQADQGAANFGMSVSGAGDVNGDGFSDIIVGAEDYDAGETDEGVVFIYHGSAGGIVTTAAVMLQENLTLSQFGFSVSKAGDVNGDGYSDVVVGAYLYNNGQPGEGVAFVYHGSASGIGSVYSVLLEVNQISASFGVSVACAGDINGDGYSDVIVGAHAYDNSENSEGGAFVFSGSSTGVNSVATAVLEINQVGAELGRSVCAAGDVNGDGYSDVIVGAHQFDNGENNEGGAFVYHGLSTGINTTAVAIVESNQADAWMGWSVASAGDVNGDGFSDVIVGARYYDNGEIDEGATFMYHGAATGIGITVAATLECNQAGAWMGWSVASAGDVNGDGYSDVIVGANVYDNGETDEGRAFVYHGSATGIITTAAATLESNQAFANLGVSVASAGDVNGDGYSDVIVGTYAYDNGETNEGVAFVYHGSATGISTTAAATVEGNQAHAWMGWSVASAGDVNGDGYSDVIVGARYYDNGEIDEGAAFVFHGSATGISITAATTVESNQVSAEMGNSVASAGDVNGDGYGDVIVGAYYYDNGQTDEGRAFVYHGSLTGISITAAATMESNQVSAEMGISVASAGDVSGDGYSDVIVGAYLYDNGQLNEGAAFIYHGGVTGINTTAAATMESNQIGATLGFSVAGSGDVNGDGYSDVIVGARSYDNVESNEGAGFVYHGNSPGTNKRNNLRLYNTDLTTPVNSSNYTSGNFGAGLFAKSFLGRSRGKLVWETRLSFNPWSGTPITNSTLFTAQQASYTDMGLAGFEITNLIAKIMAGGKFTKLRARVKYDPVTAITGQVYSPWRYVSSIIDANHLGVLPIELISFNASWIQKGASAKLEFKTDKESGICCFGVEKSADGFNFYSIGTLPAKNIPGVQHYQFTDHNATGKNQYYRIRIKGIGGQIEYSNIQQLNSDKATEILVFPNPTTDVLQLQLNNTYNKMDVQVINAAGQTVKQLNNLAPSNQSLSIPVRELAPGRYWLRLQSGGEKQVLQFVKF